MKYNILIPKKVAKQIASLPVKVKKKLIHAIDLLADAPRPNGCTKLASSEFYRIRVGDYRIIYGIEDEKLTILIIRASHRREVYRDNP